jgi:hypothetical protein
LRTDQRRSNCATPKTARADFLAAHDIAPSQRDIDVDLAMVSLAEGKAGRSDRIL